ncbi:MAG TPA: NUDIX domain-containing protein [bacterium]|nr:NUDIX domain-containing protein [bacterium]
MPIAKAYTLVFLIDPATERVLFLHRTADRADMPGYLNGLGGKFQPGEDPATAAAREVWEEAGVQALDMRFRGTEAWISVKDDGTEHDRGTLFLCTASRWEGICRDKCAEGTLHWHTLPEAIAHPALAPNLGRILTAVVDQPDAFYAGVARYGGADGYRLIDHGYMVW